MKHLQDGDARVVHIRDIIQRQRIHQPPDVECSECTRPECVMNAATVRELENGDRSAVSNIAGWCLVGASILVSIAILYTHRAWL